MSQTIFGPITSLTCEAFCDKVNTHFGKGATHAEAVYKAFYKKGDPHLAKNKEEPQADALIEAMIHNTSFPKSQLLTLKEEGEVKKFLLELPDHLFTESVLIPMKFGKTLCISSQVGCKMGCAFCETGKMGRLRSLEVEEIIQQVVFAKQELKEPIRNIVFMGMGEPFDNFNHVMQAIKVLTDPKGLSFGPSRITVSTSGLCDEIRRFADVADPGVHLAVSVNAPNDAIRNKIMPINRRYPMQALKEAMLYYCQDSKREILAEYVLIDGVNDALEHAEELIEYLDGLRVKINLIAYNPQSRDRFQPPPEAVCDAFLHYLRDRGMEALLRKTKGQKIMAACGQLGDLHLRKKLRLETHHQ